MRTKFLFLIQILLFTPLTTQAQTMKVMSYNIRYDNPNDGENKWDNRKDAIVNLIRYYQPDFIGVQEALLHQLNYIEDNLPHLDSTKFDLISHNTFWLSESSDVGSIGWDAAITRVCTYGIFRAKIDSTEIAVFNTHFDHKGRTARLRSAELILEKIDNLTHDSTKIILTGDFNSLPDSLPIQTLSTVLDDGAAISQTGLYGPIGTFNWFDKDAELKARIDYIFTKNVIVHSYRHIDDRRPNNYWVADHLPVFVEMGY